MRAAPREPGAPPTKAESRRAKTYTVVTISLYHDDLAAIDARVEALKQRGVQRVNRSSFLRAAALHLDLDRVPRRL